MTHQSIVTTTSYQSVDPAMSVSAPTALAVAGGVLLAAGALAYAVARSSARRAAHLKRADVPASLDGVANRLRGLAEAGAEPVIYSAVFGLVHADAPLLSTAWAKNEIKSVAVRRVQTLHVDVLGVHEQQRREVATQTSASIGSNGELLAGLTQVADSVKTTHHAQWRRVTEPLHADFDVVPFSIADASECRVSVVCLPSDLPMYRVFNDFVAAAPAGAAGAPMISINVNTGAAAAPMTGDVDRRVVGTQREEWVLPCEKPLLVVGQVSLARDGSGPLIAAPSDGRPFVVSSLSLDQVIANAEGDASVATRISRVSGGLGLALVLAAVAVRALKSQ